MVEIKGAIDRMFDQQLRSTAECQRSAQILLETIGEWNAQGHILRSAVSFSPHFSDSGFTKTLVNCLTDMIMNSIDARMAELGTLCFCVLCVTDGEFITPAKARNN